MSMKFCPRCGNPIQIINGVTPNFCVICSNKLNPNANPVQTKQVQRFPPQIKQRLDVNPGPLKRVPKPQFPPRRVRTLRPQFTPAQVSTTMQPKPPIPILASVVIIIVIVVVVVVYVVNINKNNGTSVGNTNIGIPQGGGSSNLGDSFCASQGTLSNGCDRCLLGTAAAGNFSIEGADSSYSYNEDGTLFVTLTVEGVPPMSASGTWYCSNNEFCVDCQYFSVCYPYSVNGSTVSWGTPH